MTKWFGSRKEFVCKKKKKQQKIDFFTRPVSQNIKKMNEYMRSRGLEHNFIEKQELLQFIASVYGKRDQKMRVCVTSSNGNVWFTYERALEHVEFIPLPTYSRQS